jgi:predicted transcriptional regulator
MYFPIIAFGNAKKLTEEIDQLKKEKEEIKQALTKIKGEIEEIVKRLS